jgi:hypothetical protein
VRASATNATAQRPSRPTGDAPLTAQFPLEGHACRTALHHLAE